MKNQRVFHLLLAAVILLLILSGCGSKDVTQKAETELPLSTSPHPNPPGSNDIVPRAGAKLEGKIEMEPAQRAFISLEISKDGKSIKWAQVDLSGIECPGSTLGGVIIPENNAAPVEHGSFVMDSKDIGKISGTFTSPTSANGSIHLLLNDYWTNPPEYVECGTWDWSAESQ